MVERIRLPDAWAAMEHFFQQEMLEAVSRDPDESCFGQATVETLAVHVVMAGCQPAYFPVVLIVLTSADFSEHVSG